jgi:hypothetical protein
LSEIFVLVLKKRPFRSVHLIGNTQSPDLDDFGVGVRNTPNQTVKYYICIGGGGFGILIYRNFL